MTNDKKKEMTLEELLELASSEAIPVPSSHDLEADPSILSFIQDKQIRSGETRIKPEVLYLTYKLWCDGRGRKPLEYRQFFMKFKEAITINTKVSHGKKSYYLNAESFDLSREFYFKARAEMTRQLGTYLERWGVPDGRKRSQKKVT